MNYLNYVLALILFLIFVYITFIKYGDKSYISKIVFLNCDDITIIEAFNKLDITGNEYMEKYILNNNNDFKIIMRRNDGIGASVRLNKVYLSNGFKDKLFLESFRDVLHESRHIMDKNLIRIQAILAYFTFGLFAILLIVFMLPLLKIIKYNYYINLFRFVFSIVGIVTLFIFSLISITSENNAIRHVPINCKIRLKELNFDENIIIKIQEYLSLQATYISEWYTMQLVGGFLFLLCLFFVTI